MKRFILLLAFLAIPAYAESVCSVHDGDTFTLCTGQRVRLFGVDAPEIKQPFGAQSRDYLAKEIQGQDVNLNCPSKSYDRIVCHVVVQGVDVGGYMVQGGMAFDSPRYSHGVYKADEAQAQEQHLGVWSQVDGGVRPWVYRHGGKK